MVKDEDGQFKSLYTKIKREDIEKIVDAYFKEVDKEVSLTGYRGCITRGAVNLNEFYYCKNKNCTSCAETKEAFNQALGDMKKE